MLKHTGQIASLALSDRGICLFIHLCKLLHLSVESKKPTRKKRVQFAKKCFVWHIFGT